MLAVVLLATTAFAWREVLRADEMMRMGHAPEPPSLAAAVAFTLQWGVMMTAMMLPSAAPMILLYQAAARRNSSRAIPAVLFALIYVAIWLATGVPVYAASVATRSLVAGAPVLAGAIPYAIALTLFAAGVYQLSPAKRACLTQCEAPQDFLMRGWRSGYAGSARLAAMHAAYCVGCCWALMVVLVAAGAMSLRWVLAIAVAAFAEKVLPGGQRTAVVIGAILIVAALAVGVSPELAGETCCAP